MRRVLITGGAGFIGSHVAAALSNQGRPITILDDFSTGRQGNLDKLTGDIEVVRGGIEDPAAVEVALRDVGAVCHHAAMASVQQSLEDPIRCTQVNVEGTVRLLEASHRAGIRRFVFAASAAAYGDHPALPVRETAMPNPLSPYAASKLAGEHYVTTYAQLYKMSALSLRYFNVFGPRQRPDSEYAAAVPRFIDALTHGRSPTIYGDGQQTRDFCYVDNVVEANLLALETDRAHGQVLNVAGGEQTRIDEVVSILRAMIAPEIQPQYAAARAGEVRASWADITRAKEVLGFEPRVSLEQGLRTTFEYYRA